VGTVSISDLILYSDAEIIIINKPSGLPVLPDGWEEDSHPLVRLLEEQVGKTWLVHRLDKITSGVMVFARAAEAHRTLSIQFEQRLTQKVYHAIVIGSPRWQETTARHPLRADAGHSHRTVVDERLGKPSETVFRVLQRFKGYCLLEAIPRTGRTHQIRAHAAAIGFPLLADRLYHSPATVLISRPALHAESLAFLHPSSVERVIFRAPYPVDFQNCLAQLAILDK
jgi:RluA family pseudouridine synthase